LAGVVQTSDGQELRIYDLRNGQRLSWLRAEYVRHPLWSPDGGRLIVGVRDSTSWSILAGAPGPGAPPDTVGRGTVGANNFDPLDYRLDTVGLAQDWVTLDAARFNPTTAPLRFDVITPASRFASLSPDGRHIAYGEESGRIVVTSLAPGGRHWQATADGTEPLWLSGSEILFRRGVSWFLARIDPGTGEPLGTPALWARDPRFSDTSGWSNRLSHDGGIIYLQGPAQVTSTYLRVVPDWVARMKSAVAEANR